LNPPIAKFVCVIVSIVGERGSGEQIDEIDFKGDLGHRSAFVSGGQRGFST
jgi:hypothetical protein